MILNSSARSCSPTKRENATPRANRGCCSRRKRAGWRRRRPSSALASTRTGKPHPKLQTLTYAEALFEAMVEGFYRDPTMVAFGEENRDWGGAFGVYRGLTEALPYPRLFNSSISEGAIVGAGVGYALERRPRRGRADVLRLHGPRRRRDLQPDGQVAGHVGRRAGDAAGAARLRRRQVRRAAFAGLVGHGRTRARAESLLPGHALRRQGHAGAGPARQRPGRLLREPAPLSGGGNAGRRRCAGRGLRRARRRAGAAQERPRPDHHHRGRHALPRPGGRPGAGRALRRFRPR